MILRYNLPTGMTDLVHTNANVPQTPYEDISTLDMTPDGQFIAFVANDNVPATATCVYRWDAQCLDTNILVSANMTGEVTIGSFVNWPASMRAGVTSFSTAPPRI